MRARVIKIDPIDELVFIKSVKGNMYTVEREGGKKSDIFTCQYREKECL